MASDETIADDQLLDAARGGDATAIEALVVRHQSRVFRFTQRMCRDPHDAEDVLQETLLAMTRSIADFRGASSISTWLYTIARSYCIKKRRRSKFAPAHEVSLTSDEGRSALELPDRGRAPDEIVHGREIESALSEAVGTLAPPYREVLLLRDVEGLPAAEVAQVMGLTVEAVKSRLHRARVSVREALAPMMGGLEIRRRGCPDMVRLFSKHLEGDVSPAVCARMEDHLSRCPYCERACESLKQTLRLCRAQPSPRVPEAVEKRLRREIEALATNPRVQGRL
jgi:RNA polymerase sigma-70 factor (ECF subfamily)